MHYRRIIIGRLVEYVFLGVHRMPFNKFCAIYVINSAVFCVYCMYLYARNAGDLALQSAQHVNRHLSNVVLSTLKCFFSECVNYLSILITNPCSPRMCFFTAFSDDVLGAPCLL